MGSTGCGGCFWPWVSERHINKSHHYNLSLCCMNITSCLFFALQASCCSSEALLTTPECVNSLIPPMPLFPEQGYSSSIRGKVWGINLASFVLVTGDAYLRTGLELQRVMRWRSNVSAIIYLGVSFTSSALWFCIKFWFGCTSQEALVCECEAHKSGTSPNKPHRYRLILTYFKLCSSAEFRSDTHCEKIKVCHRRFSTTACCSIISWRTLNILPAT